MFETLRVAARDRARLAEISGVLSRYGLDVLGARFGFGGNDAGTPPDLPRRTREAFEALGPAWVKLGQILATRADILPPHWIAEFETLHSRAPLLPFEMLRPDVEAALGEAPEAVFATFDTAPLAAASMAQVHRATLHDGTDVVVKIRRPGIRQAMEADMRLLVGIAALAERTSAEARRLRVRDMIAALGAAMLEELDFTAEGRNAESLRSDFLRDRRVSIPRVHWEYSSETLLVMDRVDGIVPVSGDALVAAGIDPDAIASAGADIILDMVLINGRFHGDPHPGNLLCQPDNRIGMIDFGLIGHVSPRRREEFVGFVRALSTDDPSLLAEMLGIWSQTDDVPRERIALVADRLIARHGGGRPLVLAAMVSDIFALLREERMVMPPDLLLIFKALVTIDGVLTGIAPDFDLGAAMRRAGPRLVASRLAPERMQRRVGAIALELDRLGDDLPRLLRVAARRLEEPRTQPNDAAAIRCAGLAIAGGLVACGAMISAALIVG